jgi:hypothetical protein
VFVLGLPGAGKSYIRARLLDRLSAMRIESESLSDYPYGYLDLLRALLRVHPPAVNGFRASDGGAFTVTRECPNRRADPAVALVGREFDEVMEPCRPRPAIATIGEIGRKYRFRQSIGHGEVNILY